MTALQYEIELIVVFFNMASLKKSINSLESRFSPRCSGRPRCKMQIGFIDRPSFYCTVMNTVTSPSLSLHGITLSFYFLTFANLKLPYVNVILLDSLSRPYQDLGMLKFLFKRRLGYLKNVVYLKRTEEKKMRHFWIYRDLSYFVTYFAHKKEFF